MLLDTPRRRAGPAAGAWLRGPRVGLGLEGRLCKGRLCSCTATPPLAERDACVAVQLRLWTSVPGVPLCRCTRVPPAHLSRLDRPGRGKGGLAVNARDDADDREAA